MRRLFVMCDARLINLGFSSFSIAKSSKNMANAKSLVSPNHSKVALQRKKNRLRQNHNRTASQATTSTATTASRHSSKSRNCQLGQPEQLQALHMATSTPSKHCPHTHTNGHSRHAVHPRVTSRHGITRMERANCSVSISLMKVVKSRQQGSIRNVTHFMKCSKKAVSTMYPVLAEFSWRRNSSQTSTMTTS